ncbi:MAG: MATE family efflux transporter [Acidobacteriales bacterium]|nr:MATE family efflux transporter [Terriglobales bacterium]
MQDLTKGSITKNILAMTSFMLVTMVVQTLYFLVDLYFVGRLGKEAVAAVSLSGNLMFIVLAVTQMLGVGTTALIAQAIGRKDKEDALLIFNQSQVMGVLVGAIFLFVGMVLRGMYANALAADPVTAELAKQYMSWFIPAMALQFLLVGTGAALRGTGNFKPGMIVSTATILLNMILAPVLIFGWGTGHPLGVAGAALASFIAIIVGVVWLTVYVVRHEVYLQFESKDWGVRFDIWKRMLKIGLPAGAEFALMWVYLVIIYFVAKPFGAAAQAGFGIGLRVVQAFFLPVVALGFAVSPVAGQNFGAQLADRVRETFRSGATMATSLMLLFTALAHIAPEASIRVFSSDPQVIAVGAEYLRIISFNFIASGLVFVSSSMFQAMGNTLPPLFSSASRIVLLAIPALVLAKLPGFDLRWIWYLSVGSVTLQMVLNLYLLQREFARKLQFQVKLPAQPEIAPA